MNQPAYSTRIADEARTKIIPFPGSTALNSSQTESEFSSQGIAEILSLKVQGAVGDMLEKYMQIFIAQKEYALSIRTAPNNPFDAIYLQKLQPDRLSRNDMIRLRAAKVIDKSSEIEFNDEMS